MENKIQNLEDELKVLKNEVQAVLLDIKDTLISGGGLISAGGLSLAFNRSAAASSVSPYGGSAINSNVQTDGISSTPLSPQQVFITQAPPSVFPPFPRDYPGNGYLDASEPPSSGKGLETFSTNNNDADMDMPAAEKKDDAIAIDFSSGNADQESMNFQPESPSLSDESDWLTKNDQEDTKDRLNEGPSILDNGWRNNETQDVDAGSKRDAPTIDNNGDTGNSSQSASESKAYYPYKRTGSNNAYTQNDRSIHQDHLKESIVNDAVDLSLLVILTPWISKAMDTVGKHHLEKLIELYDVSRDMPPRMKEAILMLLDLYEEETSQESKLSGDTVVKEGIHLLIELDGLLLRHSAGSFESALYSLLQDKMTSNRKPKSRKARHG